MASPNTGSTEVFITDLKNNIQLDHCLKQLNQQFPHLKLNVDLSQSKQPYPCGHTVLRAEGMAIRAEQIQSALRHLGLQCDLLEDKVCH